MMAVVMVVAVAVAVVQWYLVSQMATDLCHYHIYYPSWILRKTRTNPNSTPLRCPFFAGIYRLGIHNTLDFIDCTRTSSPHRAPTRVYSEWKLITRIFFFHFLPGLHSCTHSLIFPIALSFKFFCERTLIKFISRAFSILKEVLTI